MVSFVMWSIREMTNIQWSIFVSGQATVSQKPRFLSVKEGDPILLNCSYQGMEFSLQWYKQYPGGQPEFMVLLSTSGIKEKDNFKMTLDKNNKMTSLYLNNTQLKDSAVYFCALKHSARKSPAGCHQRWRATKEKFCTVGAYWWPS
uniref:Ig-like domain-containing protein n=1 Tax=Naja naja TaxID=35670 RepID=A0A8C6VLL8_NAJNA